jgi:hypothetical protein
VNIAILFRKISYLKRALISNSTGKPASFSGDTYQKEERTTKKTHTHLKLFPQSI